MAKPSQSTKPHKEAQIKAPLRFFSHVKVKKQQKLENVLEEESIKPRLSNAKGYSVKIFKDRMELVVDKNAKKPPLKKIKFSQVEAFIPNEETLCIYIGCRQGKNATVTSFGFMEDSVYAALINCLDQTSGLVEDSKSQINRPAKRNANTFSASQENSEMNYPSTEYKPVNRRVHDAYATSYILWDEMKSDSPIDPANAPRPVAGTSSASISHKSKPVVSCKDEIAAEETMTEEVHHCPCCLQRSGINLKLPSHGHKGYAPSSVDSQSRANFPAHLPHKYKCYRPRSQGPPITGEFSNDYDESTLEPSDDSESTELYPPLRHQRSLPPPIKFVERFNIPTLSRTRYQSPQYPKYPQKVRPRASRSAHQPRSTMSSSSSGYTSATVHEDGLELTVDSSTSGQYIRNQKRLATGWVRSETRKPQIYHYRKNNSGLHRFQHFRT